MRKAAPVRVEVIDPNAAHAQYCLQAYYRELAGLFADGFNPELSSLPDPTAMAPPTGCFLVAFDAEHPVGCIGVVAHHGIAEIKRLWVDPYMRGHGIAHHLLAEIEQQSIRLGYPIVRLTTHRALVAAIRLYEGAGYSETVPFNDDPYAHHWFEKSLIQSNARGETMH